MKFEVVRKIRGDGRTISGYILKYMDGNDLLITCSKAEVYFLAKTGLIENVQCVSENDYSISGINGFELKHLSIASNSDMNAVEYQVVRLKLEFIMYENTTNVKSVIMHSYNRNGARYMIPLYECGQKEVQNTSKRKVSDLKIISYFTFPGMMINKFNAYKYLDGITLMGVKVRNNGPDTCIVPHYSVDANGKVITTERVLQVGESTCIGVSDLMKFARKNSIAGDIYGDLLKIRVKPIRVANNKIVRYTGSPYHTLEDEERIGSYIKDDSGTVIEAIDLGSLPLVGKKQWIDAFHGYDSRSIAQNLGIDMEYTEYMRWLLRGRVADQPSRNRGFEFVDKFSSKITELEKRFSSKKE